MSPTDEGGFRFAPWPPTGAVETHFERLEREGLCLICKRKIEAKDGITTGPLCGRERCHKAAKRYAETPVRHDYYGTVVIKEAGE